MQPGTTRQRFGRPSPAMIISIVALITALTGSAYAALGEENFRRKHPRNLGKNSVGSRQLKSKAVTTGKVANNAITGKKVASNTLTGDDINLGQLGTVPSATNAQSAQNANTVGGHAAACPAGSTLIRGTCFDLALNPTVGGVKAAANACAAKGGYLPTPMELYSIRTVINLGTGIAPDYAVADEYYSNTTGGNYRTVTVDGTGKIEETPVDSNTRYVCAYGLVR
jgi:hypothetical protein